MTTETDGCSGAGEVIASFEIVDLDESGRVIAPDASELSLAMRCSASQAPGESSAICRCDVPDDIAVIARDPDARGGDPEDRELSSCAQWSCEWRRQCLCSHQYPLTLANGPAGS